MLDSNFSPWFVLLAVAWCSACAPTYFVVESKLVESSRNAAAETTLSQQYPEVMPTVKRVAVRAPDACAADTAASSTGADDTRKTSLFTRCGVEMAEMERSLTLAGFVVTSWKDLANLIQFERIAPAEAARRLKAHAIVQINSLEKTLSLPGADARWQRTFLQTNEAGLDVQPAMVLDAVDSTTLRNLAHPHESRLLGHKRTGAMLDATVVTVESGEALYFYRWSRVDDNPRLTLTRTLARRTPKLTRAEWRALSFPDPPQEPAAVIGGVEVEAVSAQAEAANDTDAVYHDLMRRVIGDFSKRLAQPRASLDVPPSAASQARAAPPRSLLAPAPVAEATTAARVDPVTEDEPVAHAAPSPAEASAAVGAGAAGASLGQQHRRWTARAGLGSDVGLLGIGLGVRQGGWSLHAGAGPIALTLAASRYLSAAAGSAPYVSVFGAWSLLDATPGAGLAVGYEWLARPWLALKAGLGLAWNSAAVDFDLGKLAAAELNAGYNF